MKLNRNDLSTSEGKPSPPARGRGLKPTKRHWREPSRMECRPPHGGAD